MPSRLAPEVLQSSMMDCGPAALKCLLEGFGLPVSYAKLREACQTSVDGTSIDVIEEVSVALGLDAEQVVIPADHLLEPSAAALPAMVVTQQPSGATHFIVVWAVVGRWVQVMDPAQGRMWISRQALLKQLYVHQMPVPASAWGEWAQTEEFLSPLRARLAQIVSSSQASALVERACSQPSPSSALSRLDAAARLVSMWARGSRRRRYGAWLSAIAEPEAEVELGLIPAAAWSAAPQDVDDPDEEPQVLLRGAVVLRVKGVRGAVDDEAASALAASPRLASALERTAAPASASIRALWRPVALTSRLVGVTLCALLVGLGIVEAVALQGVLSLGSELASVSQRMGAWVAAFFVFGAGLLCSWLFESVLRAMGRRIEVSARLRLFDALWRQSPEFFASRLRSDIIERAHALGLLRGHATVIFGVLMSSLTLVTLGGALIWLEPSLWLTTIGCILALVVVPWLGQPLLRERELRARAHAAALGQFMLDALMGAIPLRAHGAQALLAAEHERAVVAWSKAQRVLLQASAWIEGAQALIIAVATIVLVYRYWALHPSLVGGLLLVYWCGRIGEAGQRLGDALAAYPSLANVSLRLSDLLEVPAASPASALSSPPQAQGAHLRFDEVSVNASGHRLLSQVSLEITPGEHVAIVGSSGAGKSTLLRALLGQYTELEGELLVDGAPVSVARAWGEIAWVDPSVHLWQGSVLANVLYGAKLPDALALSMHETTLAQVIAGSEAGSARQVGEAGGALSGGEGQRVRLARGWMKEDARLVLLDEAWRGLERHVREQLMARARARWAKRTMLCVTHDLELTRGFDRVLVIEDGQLVEDGPPEALMQQPQSRYRALVEAEREVFASQWADPSWSKATLDAGKLVMTQLGSSQALASADTAPAPAPREDTVSLADFIWPVTALEDALIWVARSSSPRVAAHALAPRMSEEELSRWFDFASPGHQLRAQAVSASLDELDALMRDGGPMWIALRDEDELLYGGVLLLRSGWRGRVVIQTPTGRRVKLSRAQLRDALGLTDAISRHIEPVKARLIALGIEPSMADEATLTIIQDRLKLSLQIVGWRLQRQPAGAPLWRRVLGQVWPWLVRLIALSALGYALSIVSWWALWGALDRGAQASSDLLAWALLLLSGAPITAMAMWSGGMATLRATARQRLEMMQGALRLSPDRLRGVGQATLMGRLYEVELATTLVLQGGQGALLGAVELIAAVIVLTLAPEQGVLLLALLGWVVAMVAIGALLWRDMVRWTMSRLALTSLVVEEMLGHTTRQLQQAPARAHDQEDLALSDYMLASARWDRLSVLFGLWGSRGWLLVALVVMAPMWLTLKAQGAGLAIALGGVLLASAALNQLGASATALMRAKLAWSLASEWFTQHKPQEDHGQLATSELTLQDNSPLLSVSGLSLRRTGQVEPLLHGCELSLRRGDQLILEGPSGAGKSSLASVLAGHRQPDQGSVMLSGLDLPALGHQRWRQEVVLVPQFHQNHLFNGTLAMNLLLGARWPASDAQLAQAAQVCHALGLGPLLERMPGGLNQIVGETGWSLSHGERLRVFIARALLGRGSVVIFDESFAALDPELLGEVMAQVRQQVETMIVIAHP